MSQNFILYQIGENVVTMEPMTVDHHLEIDIRFNGRKFELNAMTLWDFAVKALAECEQEGLGYTRRKQEALAALEARKGMTA